MYSLGGLAFAIRSGYLQGILFRCEFLSVKLPTWDLPNCLKCSAFNNILISLAAISASLAHITLPPRFENWLQTPGKISSSDSNLPFNGMALTLGIIEVDFSVLILTKWDTAASYLPIL